MHPVVRGPCALCGAGGAHGGLCTPCRDELPVLPEAVCAVCAAPVPTGAVCGACLAHRPRCDGVTAAYAYDFPVDALVRAYKYGGELRLAPLLARELACRVAGHVDAVVPMPLSADRLRERGYNQALLIAREIAGILRLPLWPQACRRVIDTPAQALLPWRERARNVRGAFVCDADVNGLTVAVVDDVLTTGATLNELARNLKRAGAAAVYGWVVARTVRRDWRTHEVDFE